jgi:hypothetical protein
VAPPLPPAIAWDTSDEADIARWGATVAAITEQSERDMADLLHRIEQQLAEG